MTETGQKITQKEESLVKQGTGSGGTTYERRIRSIKQDTGSGGTTHTADGVHVVRHFTHAGVHPFETVEWERRSAVISGENEEIVFEQHEVEIPKTWSQLATNVVVSKYFRGPMGTPQREHSVRQLIGRVVNTITAWGKKDGYFTDTDSAQTFSDELTHLLVEQKLAFNSPVWFNVGVEPHPQCSACFILSVDDSMESILDWYRKEGIIFKGGSGSGVNLSHIRSSKEGLSHGGTASGPVSFMQAADISAGVIKSGGADEKIGEDVCPECRPSRHHRIYTVQS